MQQIYALVSGVAPTDSTVLIQGESGTGKELVARALHYGSLRAHEPFIALNCAAFTESLLESELFGHVRGSFTGSTADKKGLFEVADRGTLFLDEVGDLPVTTQVKLLRVLEEREFLPVGSTRPIRVDIRILAATNKHLEEEVQAGRFREDLFFRLNVIPIEIPPLRHRKEDIPLLAGQFLAMYSLRMRKGVSSLDQAVMELLVNYDWPGNVRELESTIQRAVALTDSDRITTRQLPRKILEETKRVIGKEEPFIPPQGMNLEEEMRALEKRFMEKALDLTHGNLTEAAKLLGMTFRSLRYKVKKLGIDRGGHGTGGDDANLR